MEKTFTAVDEARPGLAWRDRFLAHWPSTRTWYLKQGLAARPTYSEGRGALDRFMPELVPIYDELCSLVGEDDVARRWLTCWNPPPVIDGCSVAVWLGSGGPALARNYDFQLDLTAGRIERSSWGRHQVIAMSGGLRGPWGALDGMNEYGLVVAVTFGGSVVHGRGFASVLVLRYMLETCRSVTDAVAVLTRIPVGMSQNVVILDSTGAHATVFVGPDRAPLVTNERVCTNHQEALVTPEQEARTHTLERKRRLASQLATAGASFSELIDALLLPPLYRRLRPQGFATVYTAVYRPAEGLVEYRWPGKIWRQSFESFDPGTYTHEFGLAA